jgi:hypothetical protein
MSDTQQQTFSSVLSINPYKGTYFIGSAGHVKTTLKPQYAKTQYVISYLNTSAFITALIGVSKNLPDEDLAFAIENKVYEELALDMAVEYNIQFIEAVNNVDEKERFFHVFVMDPLTLEETFTAEVDKIKYIDQIVPVPLLIQPLYQREIIEDIGVHCFIYFQDNDAFFTIYDEKEFVYTKSLKFSFQQMHERFCELHGEQIDKGLFLELLSNQGLRSENSEYQQHLIKLFGELFLHINDVLTYAKRAYELEKIDQVYIGSQIGSIAGLDEYCQTYLGLASKPFDFDYGFDTEGVYIDQIHMLMQLYTMLDAEERYECNFSIYHRPPKFLKRHSGKLIATIAISLVVAFAYPGVYWGLTFAEQLHKALLDDEYSELHNIRVTRETTINLKNAEKTRVQKLVDAEQAEFNEKKRTLEKIHDVKVNYPMKAKIITAFSQDLNRHHVQMSDVKYTEDKNNKVFTFYLVAKKDKYITNLLEFLTKKRGQKYHYVLEEIAFDDEKNIYLSEMKAVIK